MVNVFQHQPASSLHTLWEGEGRGKTASGRAADSIHSRLVPINCTVKTHSQPEQVTLEATQTLLALRCTCTVPKAPADNGNGLNPLHHGDPNHYSLTLPSICSPMWSTTGSLSHFFDSILSMALFPEPRSPSNMRHTLWSPPTS